MLLLKDEEDGDDFGLNKSCFYFYFNTFQRFGILNFDSATLELNLGALKCCNSKDVLGHWKPAKSEQLYRPMSAVIVLLVYDQLLNP